MSWWQNWRHALAHPADNVVAAMVVLAGVAITAITTLLVSAANRRHERGKEARDRVFQPRADAYVAARTWLREDLGNASKQDKEEYRQQEVPENFKELTARIAIYGSREAVKAFENGWRGNKKYFNLRHKQEAPEVSTSAYREASAALADFEEIARQDVQQLRHTLLFRSRRRQKV